MSPLDKKTWIYEGKAKTIFATPNPEELIQEYKDALTAFNAQKKGSFLGKGAINLKISSCIFHILSRHGIRNHFIRNLDDKSMLVERLKMFPIEVVVRNKAAGSLSQRLGLKEGHALPKPMVEFFYKKDELNDPLVTEDHIALLNLATATELDSLKHQALRINEVLREVFSEIGIDLVDFKIEFGKNKKGEILLADEISPDSCRLWDKNSQEKLDKDRFRRDLGRVEESYQLVCDKLLKRWGENS